MPKYFDDVQKVHAEVDRSLVRAQAVAWAWYQHGGGSRGHGNASEAGAARNVMNKFARRQPSRFKVEAELRKTSGRSSSIEPEGGRHSLDETGYTSSISNENRSLEFKSSLFDSFDLLSISKQLDESVRQKTTTQGPNMPESRSGGAATPRILGSNTAKKSPFQDSRRDRALFQFRIRGSLCRSADIVSCQAAGRRVQGENQSSLTVVHTKPNANDAPVFKRCSSARASKKQTRYAQSTEENQESRDRKKEKFLHLMSFKDVSKVLQQVNHLPQSHSDHHQRPEHHHHHLHHHHHHYVQFHEKQLDRITVQSGREHS